MRTSDLLNAANVDLLESLYSQYRANPASVTKDWADFFAGLDSGVTTGPAVTNGGAVKTSAPAPAAYTNGSGAATATPVTPAASLGIYGLVQAYRDLGHLEADINPLEPPARPHPLLNLAEFGLAPADLDRPVGKANFQGATDGTLRDLIEKLRITYCGTLGAEYTHITDKDQRLWLQMRMEQSLNRPQFKPEEKLKLLGSLSQAEAFERFLDVKFKGKKRFSLEGADALIPMLEVMVSEGEQLGVEEAVLGMAHRGRLNVLANTLEKPLEVMFAEIKDAVVPTVGEGDGDVKYHLGYSNDRHFPSGRKVHLSLLYNPSHLELVNPIVEGVVRAKQIMFGDRDCSRVVPVLIHGDAAFPGQGIVGETLTLCRLNGHQTGGTVHVVIDNQVGFTAEWNETRFTRYPTDIMKMAGAPIFHVNADDVDACAHAMRLAIAFRQRFKTDVMIHLLGYRRHGHNETDEPRFTQPLMYAKIDKHPTARTIYEQQLRREGILSDQQAAQIAAAVRGRLDSALANAEAAPAKKLSTSLGGIWRGLTRAPLDQRDWEVDTAVPADTLLKVIDAACRIPDGFTPHPNIRKLYDRRLKSVHDGAGIDWATAEILAFGSLLTENFRVRLVGQDSERGTFSQRQVVIRDINDGRRLAPIADLNPARFTVLNSMLSEEAVLGFEYGVSTADPRCLVMWEGQFGDFVNGAQAVIDQYLVSGESKWQRMSGLVLLLPHGYEGQGPEHSNARPERFLQLCAEHNIQVCWPTTPAQHFHVLRRQLRRDFRKPLILMTPKSLLRAPACTSTTAEFASDRFRLVYDDPMFAAPGSDRSAVRRLLLCSGKVYYTLAAARQQHAIRDTAIIRLEQLYPFPVDALKAVASAYTGASECAWVQEEPRNMGAWRFVRNRLAECLPAALSPSYVGRKNSASPATGSFHQHELEEKTLVAEALHLGGVAPAPTHGIPDVNGSGIGPAVRIPARAK